MQVQFKQCLREGYNRSRMRSQLYSWQLRGLGGGEADVCLSPEKGIKQNTSASTVLFLFCFNNLRIDYGVIPKKPSDLCKSVCENTFKKEHSQWSFMFIFNIKASSRCFCFFKSL